MYARLSLMELIQHSSDPFATVLKDKMTLMGVAEASKDCQINMRLTVHKLVCSMYNISISNTKNGESTVKRTRIMFIAHIEKIRPLFNDHH